MSVFNLVAYLIGWSVLLLKKPSHSVIKWAINFSRTYYKLTQLGNTRRFYASFASLDYESLLVALLAKKAF